MPSVALGLGLSQLTCRFHYNMLENRGSPSDATIRVSRRYTQRGLPVRARVLRALCQLGCHGRTRLAAARLHHGADAVHIRRVPVCIRSHRYSIGAQRCAVPVAACAVGVETALSRFAIDGGRLRLLRTHQPAGNPAALSASIWRQRGCLPAHTAIDVADLALRLASSGTPDAHVACRWLYRLRRRVLDLPAAQWPLRGGTCTGYLGQAFR